MMEFINRILSIGISENADTSTVNRIKSLRVFYWSMVLMLMLSVILSTVLGNKPLLIINVGFMAGYILAYLAFSPTRSMILSGVLGLALTGLMMLLAYLFVPELSSKLMLAFFLIFPIISITMQVYRSVWISIALGVAILVVNYVPITNLFRPLETLSLAIFILIYVVVVIVSYFVEKSQRKLVEKQTMTADYYESEIRQKDEFISQLSHKLRTSLSNITLINTLVHDSRMSSAQKELLDTLKTPTSDLINDVNELVEIATPAIIDFKQSILSFNLAEALDGAKSILVSDDDFTARIDLKGAENLDYNVIGDPSLLRSILINLIKGINDFKFTDDDLTLSVMIDYESQNLYRLKFSIDFDCNDRSGLRTLLNSIQRKKEQRTSKLSNASHLLALTASALEYTFEGARLQIYFYQDIGKDPTRKTVDAEPLSKAEQAIVRGSKRSLQNATLLLVEDNAINQKIVLLSLNSQVSQIDVANNGKEALDMFGTKKYDLILMDIQMPVMDGITATKKIREIESTSEERVPIIAITANALAGDRDNCLAAGVDDYVSKPFQVDDVIEKISLLLEK